MASSCPRPVTGRERNRILRRSYPGAVSTAIPPAAATSAVATPEVLAGLDAYRDLPAAQQPAWPDADALAAVREELVVDAAAGVRRRGRPAARPPGGGRRRSRVPAPGRRLRRDLRRRHRRPDPQPDQDRAADGRRAHLRLLDAGDQDGPDGRAVRQAAVQRRRDPRRRHAAGVPRRRRERLRLHPAVAHARPAAAAAGVPHGGVDPEPHPRLHHRRFRRPAPGARVEQGLRRVGRQRPVRGARGGDRPRDAVHGRLRRRLRRAAHGRVLLQPRGAAARLRAGDDADRLAHRRPVRRVGALPLDRRAHPPARRRARRPAVARPQPDRGQARAERPPPTTRSR